MMRKVVPYLRGLVMTIEEFFLLGGSLTPKELSLYGQMFDGGDYAGLYSVNPFDGPRQQTVRTIEFIADKLITTGPPFEPKKHHPIHKYGIAFDVDHNVCLKTVEIISRARTVLPGMEADANSRYIFL